MLPILDWEKKPGIAILKNVNSAILLEEALKNGYLKQWDQGYRESNFKSFTLTTKGAKFLRPLITIKEGESCL